jgi:hypothetical protein
MAVIALAALIVITHTANVVHDISQPVFVAVRAAWDRLRNLPHNQLGKAEANDKPGSRDFSRFGH